MAHSAVRTTEMKPWPLSVLKLSCSLTISNFFGTVTMFSYQWRFNAVDGTSVCSNARSRFFIFF